MKKLVLLSLLLIMISKPCNALNQDNELSQEVEVNDIIVNIPPYYLFIPREMMIPMRTEKDCIDNIIMFKKSLF